MESFLVHCEETRVEPVSERQDPKIKIVVACCRAMDDDRTDKTISVLD